MSIHCIAGTYEALSSFPPPLPFLPCLISFSSHTLLPHAIFSLPPSVFTPMILQEGSTHGIPLPALPVPRYSQMESVVVSCEIIWLVSQRKHASMLILLVTLLSRTQERQAESQRMPFTGTESRIGSWRWSKCARRRQEGAGGSDVCQAGNLLWVQTSQELSKVLKLLVITKGGPCEVESKTKGLTQCSTAMRAASFPEQR